MLVIPGNCFYHLSGNNIKNMNKIKPFLYRYIFFCIQNYKLMHVWYGKFISKAFLIDLIYKLTLQNRSNSEHEFNLASKPHYMRGRQLLTMPLQITLNSISDI